MNHYLRYKDLVDRGIVSNRQTLARWVAHRGFPPGVLLGPNTRAWQESEVLAWLAERPPVRVPAELPPRPRPAPLPPRRVPPECPLPPRG